MGYSAELHPGDTLLIPSGYTHDIKYITSGFSMCLRAYPSRTACFVGNLRVWCRAAFAFAFLPLLALVGLRKAWLAAMCAAADTARSALLCFYSNSDITGSKQMLKKYSKTLD